MIRFDGQVAIVTGAGRGMGRATALLLAQRGAKVLVNDYGGAVSTVEPGTISVAQSVVDEIVAAGGEAIANGDSVGSPETATAIVDQAIAQWGRVDILVNNAGGTTFGPIDAHDDDMMLGVIGTNLLGPYHLLRRCWPHFKRQNHGRVVNVLSSAMLGIDNLGPYALAKGGQFGLTTTAAAEGKAFNILVNGIMPVSFNRGMVDVADDFRTWISNFQPEQVAPVTAWLASAANTEVTGEVFSVGAGRVAREAMFDAAGFHDPALSIESVAANIDTARDLTNAVPVASSWDNNIRFFDVVPWTGGAPGSFGNG